MYQSIQISNTWTLWTLIDDDFTEKCDAMQYHNVWDFVVEVYEKRNLDVASNLIRSLVKWHLPIDRKQLFLHVLNETNAGRKYKSVIEKYLLFL